MSNSPRVQPDLRLPAASFVVALLLALFSGSLAAQVTAPANADNEALASALSPRAWEQVEQSIERALAWLARVQNGDGSFEAPDTAQPAATSLAIMAFISKGHMPGEGPYGRNLDLA